MNTEIPSAKVQDVKPGFIGTIAASYMWLLTLLCLFTAIGLVWWSMPSQGVQIQIHFPDGHGLEPEDTLRHRGIEVGVVESVELNHELAGVDVTVNLKPFAEPLARAGSRFWIVRPQLSLGGISGLDTAVGHKYIGVLPGDAEAAGKVRFEGMANAPPDSTNSPGTEIILQGEHRYGLNAGSPVSHRGVIVGRVLAVELAQNGRTVDTRVRVFDEFEHLVTSKTKFWANSGIDFDLRWGSGLAVDIESLETVAKGGVAMLTVGNGGKPVRPGQLFSIVGSPENEWFEKANQVDMAKTDLLRAAVSVKTIWQEKGRFFGTADKSMTFVGTHVKTGGYDFLYLPIDTIQKPEKTIGDTFRVQLVDGDHAIGVEELEAEENQVIGKIALPSNLSPTERPFSSDEFRKPEAAENCMAIRREGTGDDGTFLHLSIDINEIGEDWQVKGFNGDRNVWHGAPVVAESDGKLLGFLIVDARSAKIERVAD